MTNTTEQDNKGKGNHTGKGGFADNPQNINAGGRPKNSMKSYLAKKLAGMTPEEKEIWLKEKKISGELQFKMAEGNPKQDTSVDLTMSMGDILDEIENE